MRECTCGYGSPEGRETCIKCGKRFDAMESAASRDELRNTIASLSAELARRDEVERELRNSNGRLLQDNAALCGENASLRSRIGELEKLLKDLEGESFERDILG